MKKPQDRFALRAEGQGGGRSGELAALGIRMTTFVRAVKGSASSPSEKTGSLRVRGRVWQKCRRNRRSGTSALLASRSCVWPDFGLHLAKGQAVLWLLLFSAALGFACAPTPSPPETPRPYEPKATDTSERFAAWEGALLAELATVDPRLSRRMRFEPADADVFSFDARQTRLNTIAGRAATPPPDALGEAKETLLLSRLIAEERARVDEERQLPRSGSELIRAILATWSLPSSMTEAKERDAWLSARLDDLSTSIERAPLRAVERTELDDALDPVERLADLSGFATTAGALARLRVALGSSRAVVGRGMGWEALHQRLVVHLGIAESEPTLRAELAQTESRLRAQAKAQLDAVGEAVARAAARNSESLVLAESECKTENGHSKIRGFGPPPERALLCAKLGGYAEAGSDGGLVVLLATHDAVTLAMWAMAIHVDDVDPEETPHTLVLLSEVPPEHVGRFVRFAAVRPIACLAVARMASLLDAGGLEERQARAKRWRAFGDAPLDVVEREMGWTR